MCGCGKADEHAADRPGSVSRRGFLAATAAVGLAAGSAVLAPVDFALADPGGAPGAGAPGAGVVTRTVSGRFAPGVPDFVYLPVQVPRGVSRIEVSYSYDRPAVPPGTLGNALDIGLFDQRGHRLGAAAGFRGWSGGFRTSFFVSASEATPGYLPGPIGAGTWFVVLGPYTVAPAGLAYQVDITLSFGAPGAPFVPHYPPVRVAGRGAGWYRGDGHLHTVNSDGRRTPAEVAAAARAAGLDFIVSTEHNTSAAHGVWGPLAGDDLLIITGEEVTTRNGHYLAAGLPGGHWIDWRYRARDGALPRFLREIHHAGGLATAAHPFTPCLACSWKFGYAGMDAVEVWNGPWTLDDEVAVQQWNSLLVAGRWLPAVGNSDAHSEPQAVGLAQTVVFAEELSTRAVLSGIRAGRCWIAESSAVQVSMTAAGGGRSAGIGERLAVREDVPVTVTVEVSGVAGVAQVVLITDEGQAFATALPGGAGTVTWLTTAAVSAYVRAEVRHPGVDPTGTVPGAMAALTNPIFLGRRP
jgi:hypothetical protein